MGLGPLASAAKMQKHPVKKTNSSGDGHCALIVALSAYCAQGIQRTTVTLDDTVQLY